MVCHHLAKFGGHRYCSSRDMFLVCDVTLQNQMIEAINDFMVRSSSRYVIILPKFGDHRQFGRGDIRLLLYHVISKDHVIEG